MAASPREMSPSQQQAINQNLSQIVILHILIIPGFGRNIVGKKEFFDIGLFFRSDQAALLLTTVIGAASQVGYDLRFDCLRFSQWQVIVQAGDTFGKLLGFIQYKEWTLLSPSASR